MKLKILSTILFTFFLFHLTDAQESQPIEKKGFIFGTSFGIANSGLKFPSMSQRFTDLGLELKIGYRLNPKLAILLNSNISIYDYSGLGRDRKRDFGVLSPSIQYWISDKLWLLGGIGIGGDNPVFWDIQSPDTDPLETKYYSGLGIVSSIGYEVFRINKKIIIDLKLRAMYRKVELQEGNTSGFSYGVLAGLNLY